MSKIKNMVKDVFKFMLVSERMNSQRCLAKDLDTTKTIVDPKK